MLASTESNLFKLLFVPWMEEALRASPGKDGADEVRTVGFGLCRRAWMRESRLVKTLIMAGICDA